MYNLKDQVRIIAVSQVPIEISTKKKRKNKQTISTCKRPVNLPMKEIRD